MGILKVLLQSQNDIHYNIVWSSTKMVVEPNNNHMECTIINLFLEIVLDLTFK